jgi:hypothetical protein
MPPFVERRQHKRYSINLGVQFQIREEGKFIQGGEGKIHDVSHSGIFFESNTAVPPGMVLRLVVEWPVRFQGKTSVDWIVDGVVVRSTVSGMALKIMRQRFERGFQNKRKKLIVSQRSQYP